MRTEKQYLLHLIEERKRPANKPDNKGTFFAIPIKVFINKHRIAYIIKDMLIDSAKYGILL